MSRDFENYVHRDTPISMDSNNLTGVISMNIYPKKKRTTFPCSCIKCRVQFTPASLGMHSKYCDGTGKKKPEPEEIHKECKHCGQSYDGLTQYKKVNHSRYCSKNPNILHNKSCASESIKKRHKEGAYKDTYQKVLSTRIKNGTLKHSEESKKKMSNTMKKVAKERPDSYRGHYNRGHVKEITCTNGFKVLGSWEEKFVEFCIANNIAVEQINIGFSYMFENSERTYYPDFYLPLYDLYIEVKGYATSRDHCKWNDLMHVHGKRLYIVDKHNINKLQDIIWSNI